MTVQEPERGARPGLLVKLCDGRAELHRVQSEILRGSGPQGD